MSPLLQAHIVTAALSMVLFTIASGLGALYLLQRRQLKRKRSGRLLFLLPSLELLDRLNRRALQTGLAVLVASLAVGVAAASAVWDSAWEWTPLEIVSLALLGMYGILALVLPRWSARRRAIGTVAAFAVVVVTVLTLRGLGGTSLHAEEQRGPATPPVSTDRL